MHSKKTEFVVKFIRYVVFTFCPPPALHITLITPPDYPKIFKTIGAICLVAMIFYFLGDKIISRLEPIFKSTTLWGLLVLGWVLKMIGGHMWNVIRTPPNHGYGPEYINGSQSYQYLYETYLVAGKNTAKFEPISYS